MLTAVKLFLIRMRQILNGLFALLFAFILVSLVLDDLIFLALLPIDVLNLVLLHLEIIASLPVFLTLQVLRAVKLSEFFFYGIDQIANLVGLGPRLVLLSISLIKLFTQAIHLFVQFLLLCFNSLDLIPDLVFLTFQSFDLLIDLLVAFGSWDRSFKNFNLFNQSGLSLGAH